MKKIIPIFIILFVFKLQAQIGDFNQYPSMQPQHILDEKLEDISFAFSLRILESNYNGPLIRLRRASDNLEEDFYCGDDDRVDIEAINTWRNGANVFVSNWYDQSGLSRNAIQPVLNSQPEFVPDATQPYIVGDGLNDWLIVQASTSLLIKDGKNASIYGVFYATDRADSAFGVINPRNGRDRYLTHINWSDERCYFDPGNCCTAGRSFINNLPTNGTNPGSLTLWDQYTFIRRDNPNDTNNDRRIMRLGGIEKTNTSYLDSYQLSINYNMTLFAIATNATGTNTGSRSNTRMAEIIMYREGKNDSFSEELEQNEITFWNL